MINCQFTSDNASGIHPQVMDKLAEANVGPAMPYGDDPWTARAVESFRREFGEGCAVYPVPLGTGANVVGLRSMLQPWQCILASATAHIDTSEAGAVEAVIGAKILSLPTVDGKIRPEDVSRFADPTINAHHVQPRVLALTQSTETGTVYSVEELRALCAAAHAGGMLVHMDGTRIANAAVSLGVPLRAVSCDAGVDVLSFGGSKNGLMCGEAVVAFNPAVTEGMLTLRKQCCQLYSKMRFISAQFVAYFDNELWKRNAAHANAMGARLAEAVRNIPGVRIVYPVEANAVFAAMAPEAIERLRRHYAFGVVDPLAHVARWVCSFNTTPEEVDTFAQAIRDAVK